MITKRICSSLICNEFTDAEKRKRKSKTDRVKEGEDEEEEEEEDDDDDEEEEKDDDKEEEDDEKEEEEEEEIKEMDGGMEGWKLLWRDQMVVEGSESDRARASSPSRRAGGESMSVSGEGFTRNSPDLETDNAQSQHAAQSRRPAISLSALSHIQHAWTLISDSPNF
ncbi:hypothetical protein KOW79_002092 [Hemibagrus wyckioides]|uniref:Uncharacterized protein n=1 Tax=Hemibagrus wyckioides TaxID=337641 RepID=A0A9D3P2V5_9TELE|nr:hypothetical protein KOW79_002092 [Hemibagrus wyckioides]